MGGIFAKLDNQDKIVSLEKKTLNNIKDDSSLNLEILKDYINKHGYVRVDVDLNQLESYINSFGTKYFSKNLEELKKIYSSLSVSYGIGSMMISSYGLMVLAEKGSTNENFSNIFGNVNYNYEKFADTPDVSEQKPISEGSNQQYYILLPKIYFSNERNTFIDFLIDSLPKSGPNVEQNKIIYTFVKTLMNKINETPNPEVKVVNTIGLLVRIGLIMTFYNLLQTQSSTYSDDEKIQILTGLITDNLEDIPYDDCVFYNEKINFIKFTPNVCALAKDEKEIRLKKLYETKCPVQEQIKCPVQEQMKCPEQEQMKCPVQEQMKCSEQESEQSSNLWKYSSILLTIIVIVMVLIMFFKSPGKEENLKNLAKLN
jgi:hypothetical protein